MRRFLVLTALAVGLGLPGLGGLGTVAQAQDFELRIERGDRCNPRFERCRGERYRDESRRESRRERRRGCSEGDALDKADRMGVRRARIMSAGRRTIDVRGRDRDGDRVVVTFSRERGCPVLNEFHRK